MPRSYLSGVLCSRGVWVGLAAATAITLLSVFTRVVSRPWHARGTCQPVTSVVNGLDHLAQQPGMSVTRGLGVRNPVRPTFLSWLVSLGINVVIYTLSGRCLWALCRARPEGTTDDGRTCSRRRFLLAGMGTAAGAAVGFGGYAFLVEPRWFVVTRRVLPVRGLPHALDGLVAVQLTDIHHGPWVSREQLREVVRAVNDVAPDLVLLTGDYVDSSPVYHGPVAEELADLRPRVATLGVLGNHDWWEDARRSRRAFARVGLPLIDNDRRVLTPDRRLVHDADEGLALCGVGDLWEGKPDYAKALGGLPDEMPRLLLSHNPDVAEEPDLINSGLRVDWIVSGHTHGGQVRLPLVDTPLPSRYGLKYAEGVVRGPVCDVFVCRGIGLAMLPLRFGAPPEVAVLELRAA